MSKQYLSCTISWSLITCLLIIILGRLTFNTIGAIVSTKHLAMKFVSSNGKVVIIKGNQQVARQCYSASLLVPKESLRKCV